MTKSSDKNDDHRPRRQRFKTVPQFAETVNVSERKIWRDIEVGGLRVHRFGGSTRIFDEDGDDYIRRSRD